MSEGEGGRKKRVGRREVRHVSVCPSVGSGRVCGRDEREMGCAWGKVTIPKVQMLCKKRMKHSRECVNNAV